MMKLLLGLTLLSVVVAVAKLNPDKITCPVLAAMYNGGDLHPDEDGSITLEDMHDGAKKVGMDEYTASFFAVGVVVYNETHKKDQLHRDRCYPGTPCFSEKLRDKGKVNDETERYLNIFKMNGLQTVEHGFSTGTRGGWNNPPDYDFASKTCNGIYPCEDHFEKFWVPCADPNGRFYRDNILCSVCRAQEHGDRGGEWSFNPVASLQAWQMNVASLSMLAGWGRLPTPDADPYGPETHFTMSDMRELFFNGTYPTGWQKRNWSNSTMIKDLTETVLPCHDQYRQAKPWWVNSSCPVNTGVPCAPVFGMLYPEGCPKGSTCTTSGYCVCGRTSPSGVSLCANGKGQCVEREDKCTYFGEPCVNTPADNLKAPW
jgi:hypothetical protein